MILDGQDATARTATEEWLTWGVWQREVSGTISGRCTCSTAEAARVDVKWLSKQKKEAWGAPSHNRKSVGESRVKVESERS